MRPRAASATRGQVAAVVVVALVVATLLLNLRVDRLGADFPARSGPCLTRQETACRHNFVN